jgi:hypothetical protein
LDIDDERRWTAMANGDDRGEKKGCDPNLKLRDYLIRLAIEDDLRAELDGKNDSDRKSAIVKHNLANPLDPADVDALVRRDDVDVTDLLRCNQQNT